MTTPESFRAELQRFGLSQFRKGQEEIIASLAANRDALAILPTGGGKSLCFQLFAIYRKQLVIVVSPLIALMKDQVLGLQKRGIPAGCIHSGQREAEKRQVFQEISAGGAYILYLSPERTQKEGFLSWIKNRDLGLIAIDEAHCVSQWGHDFRPEYAQLKIFKELRPDVPVLALTASATPIVLKDVAKSLGLNKPVHHVHGFYRPNLYYQVECCASAELKFEMLKCALRQTPTGRVIIYCGTRRATEEVAERLAGEFDGVAHYHAGMSTAERNRVQEEYSNAESRILVATNAFGMGIDHPDVRLVVHFNLPANIDSLYQEMGRAGRDGLDATCLLLYSSKDKGLQSFFIQSSEAPRHIKNFRWNTLNALIDYSEGSECRHSEILAYYQDSQRIQKCGHCDTCAPASPRRIQTAGLEAKITKPRAEKKRAQTLNEEPLDATEKIRFELLREWRRDKAKELEVAAFIIFSDRTLRQIAKAAPASIDQLPEIHGLGPAKIERFGGEILEALGRPRSCASD